MVVWAFTAGMGVYLLGVGIARQRTAAAAGKTAQVTDGEPPDEAPLVGRAALAMVLQDAPAARGQPRVEGSPLLEFVHPALALVGLTFWIFFVMTGYRTFAWVAFGVAAATVTAGLSWELAARRTARRCRGEQGREQAGPSFPPHLITMHGLAAACTVALVVIAAVTAGHG